MYTFCLKLKKTNMVVFEDIKGHSLANQNVVY